MVRERIRQYYALILIFILFSGYLIIHIYNGRFQMLDFQVYFRAAGRIAEGQNLYRIVEDGFYIFKYSTVSAVYFIPLSWLPLEAAKVVFWLSSTLAFCIVLALFYKMGEVMQYQLKAGKRNLLMLISFVCIGAFIELEIHLGQVNVFLLLLLLLSAIASMEKKPVIAGLLLSISIFLKPFGLVLLAYYLYRMRFREVMVFAGFSILLFFLPLLFYGSFDMLIGQNRLWIQELIIEMGNKQDILAPRTHTLFSVFARYTPLRWIEWTTAGTLILQCSLLSIIGGLFISLRWRARSHDRLEVFELALLLCLIPLVLYTGRNLYMFSGLAVALLLIGFSSLNRLSRILFITGIMISCFNIVEIWGDTITSKWEDWSLISVGTAMIWMVLYINAFRLSGRNYAAP